MSVQQSSTASAQAHVIISTAFERFKTTVTPEDVTLFNSTSADEVIQSLRVIQDDLRLKRENRNLSKLVPFLQGLKTYGQAIDVLSNGLSPFLPWAWAPVRLLLQITSDHLGAFDKLLDAYSRIADTLPRITTLGESFRDKPSMLTKLALYYADLVEFHRRAYKFVRRRSWKTFFMTTWGQFDLRFESILTSLAYHSDLVTQEAQAIDLIEARRWRDDLMTIAEQKEEERRERQRLSIISWLAVTSDSQEDERERLLRNCVPGTCDWLWGKLDPWLQNTSTRQSVVWMHGMPGSGKSVLCASLIDTLKSNTLPIIYCFCRHGTLSTSSDILKSLVLQTIAYNKEDIIPIAYSEFILRHTAPSGNILRDMLVGSADREGFLRIISPCRIVVDGMDECGDDEQKLIVENLLHISSSKTSSPNVQLFLCSRDIPNISATLRKKAKTLTEISLSSEHEIMNSSIRGFVSKRLEDIQQSSDTFLMDGESVESIQQEIVDRAGGMFLWAKLVLDALSEVDSMGELHDAITEMPGGLPDLYAKILLRIATRIGEQQMRKVYRILAWLVFAQRPLRRHEVLHGAAITYENPVLNQWSTLQPAAIDKCRPLIEEVHGGTINVVHYTIEEYLRKHHEISGFGALERPQWIAFSCLSVLKAGFVLIDPATPPDDQLSLVAQGSHSLLPYAVDFWIRHLEDAVPSRLLTPASPLFAALAALNTEHARLCHELKHSTMNSAIISNNEGYPLNSVPLYASYSSFQKEQGTQSTAVLQEPPLAPDPTLLSTLSTTLGSLMQRLASGDATLGLSREQLNLVRDYNGFLLFRCRHSACVYSSLGFSTETARAAHERIHAQGLFCDQPGCHRGRVGFKSLQALKRHVRTSHREGGILVPPRVRQVRQVPLAQISQEVNREVSAEANQDVSVDKYETATETPPEWSYLNCPKGMTMGVQVLLNSNTKHPFLEPDGILSEGTDWICFYTPNRHQRLGIGLLKTLMFDSVASFVQFSHNGRLVAVCAEGATYVHDTSSGDRIATLQRESTLANLYDRSASFSPDDEVLAIGSETGLLTIWDLAGTRILKTFTHSEENNVDIYRVDFSHDGTLVASGGGDRTVKLWGISDDSGAKYRRVFVIPDGVTSLAFSINDESFIIGSLDNVVYLWDLKQAHITTRQGHTDSVYDVHCSLDGKSILSASLDHTVKVWSTTDSHCQRTLAGHESFVFSVKSTNHRDGGGNWIVSGSKDRSFRIWNPETGDCEIVVKGHDASVISVDTSVLDGISCIASASKDKRVRIWAYSDLDLRATETT